MHRRFVVYSFIIATSLFSLFAQVPATTIGTWRSNERIEQTSFLLPSSLTAHNPITVDGDQNFTNTALAEGWQGNGSSQNPYIIDTLEIDRGGAPGHCISISNTRVNFTISNCHLTGASIDPGAGVFLNNVSYAEIINNNCSSNRFGISLASRSDHNSIINNTCNGNNRGIKVVSSYYNTIEGNFCDGNGDGIYLIGSESCQVNCNWVNNSAWSGIHFEGVDIGSITNNTCQYNGQSGIEYVASDRGFIANNTCRNNTWFGAYLFFSSNSIFTNNTFVNNGYGIFIESGPSSCVFTWNILEANRNLNAEDHGDTPGEIMYNYWSDYAGNDSDNDGIGDTPHVLPDAIDPYPLIYYPTPPRWISIPQDVEIEQSDEIFHAFYSAFAPAPLTWWVSDGVHFAIDDSGHLISLYFLEAITYDLRIVVSNIYGLAISADITIRVTEDISPSWMIAPLNQTIERDEAFDYYVAAIDSSGIAKWILLSSSYFTLTEYYFEGGSTARLTNTSVLASGTYLLNISVFDTHGNRLSALLYVTVKQPAVDTTSPSWVIASLTHTLEFGELLSIQMGAWDASSIDHYWINDTVNFAIDESGLITNGITLQVGEYSLEVRAYDPSGNYCSVILIIIVVPPRLTLPLDVFAALNLAAGMGFTVVVIAAIVFFRKWQSKTEES